MRCAACGAEVDGAETLRFTCPKAEVGDGVDHLLTPVPSEGSGWPDADEANPFIRYRELLFSYRLAMAAGLDDAGYCDLVRRLDDAVAAVDGAGFRETPLVHVPQLGARVWVKNETGHVGGSHKARHLMATMITLQVAEAAGVSPAKGAPMAIASCGNAALAAAVVARAAQRELDVYIPEDAPESVVARLGELGASLQVCERDPAGQGDPCMTAFRAAVANGSVPFSVQGPENGLVVEGASTLAWEIVDQLRQSGREPGALFIQVGGGALASGCCEGLLVAHRRGVLSNWPTVYTVQTTGAHPLERAYGRLRDLARATSLQSALDYARTRRAGFMWPWETPPSSVAHGILDDETYDWAIPVETMFATGGDALVVDEATLIEAHTRGREATGIDVSATGTAGLAGLMSIGDAGADRGETVVLFTGAAR